MNVTIYTPPYSEAIHLDEIKNHIKVDQDVTLDDTLLSSQMAAARDVIETMTGANAIRNRVMLATTFDYTLDCFPYWNVILLPKAPLISVTSITYVDADGTTQTLATTVYSVNVGEGRIYLAYNQTWPVTRGSIEDRVTVRFVAGVAAVFTAATSDTCTVSGRVFADTDRVQVLNSGGVLPSGLSALTTYFVRDVSGSTFKLALTSGGTAVDITATGSGTHYIGLDLTGFETLRNAMKLYVGRLYANRGDGGRGDDAASRAAIEALVSSQHA